MANCWRCKKEFEPKDTDKNTCPECKENLTKFFETLSKDETVALCACTNYKLYALLVNAGRKEELVKFIEANKELVTRFRESCGLEGEFDLDAWFEKGNQKGLKNDTTGVTSKDS